MAPELSARSIIEFDHHIHPALRPVVRNDEGGGAAGWILRHAHIEERWSQTAYHIEVEGSGRTVVLDIPRREGKLMPAWRKFRNAVAGGTAGIGSEIIREVIVEIVGLRLISVYHQLQVMAESASCGIDSVLV